MINLDNLWESCLMVSFNYDCDVGKRRHWEGVGRRALSLTEFNFSQEMRLA